MIRHIFSLLILIVTGSIFAQDTLVVDAHTSTQMVWHVNYDKKAYFPTEGKTYRKIYMYFTLGCADGGCSGWDYDVLTQILHNTGRIDSAVQNLDTTSTEPLIVDTTWRVYDVMEPYELGRLITPYGTYMRDNSNGFNNDWTHTFKYDVTDYISLLKDSVIIRAKYNGWSAGFSADIKFEFIEGTPQREVIALQNIYAQGGGYNNTEQFERDVIPAKTFKIPEGTKSAQAKVLVTGHGNNSGSNCGEFCDKDYYFSVNGSKEFTHRMWREDCGAVPVRPQGGTYLYPRANWCPGDKVAEQRWELTPFMSGDSITLDMDIEAYTNQAGGGGSSHNISSTVFFYGEDKYAFDAELNTIMAPSTESEFMNYNPSCGEVIVVIKNNSRTPLTYSKIEYGPEGGKMRIEEWTGNLAFEQMDTVYLPAPYWTGIDAGHTKFIAKLITPNRSYSDDNPANDMYISDIELAPRWEPIRVLFRSNGQPQENKITITNEKGEVVWELGDFDPNTTYDENLTLPEGCYQFLLTDENEDGLDWWVYRQTGQNTRTGGSMRIFKQSGGLYATAVDFGREFRANFIVGKMDVQEAPIQGATSFDVFPNPTEGKVSVLIPAFNEGTVKIEVIDRLGRILLERENTPSDLEHWEILDFTGLQQDMYFVKVSLGDNIFTKKILKQD